MAHYITRNEAKAALQEIIGYMTGKYGLMNTMWYPKLGLLEIQANAVKSLKPLVHGIQDAVETWQNLDEDCDEATTCDEVLINDLRALANSL
jgi:hypothetical protein